MFIVGDCERLVSLAAMPFDFSEFVSNPSVSGLTGTDLKKADWINIALHYKIHIKTSWRKSEIKRTVINALVNMEVLELDALSLCDEPEKSVNIREMEIQLERERLTDRERERAFQLTMIEKKLQLSMDKQDFDVTKVTKWIPNFNENDPEEFFIQFEHVATTLSWPDRFWSVLVQTALHGKSLSTYLSLESTQQSNYNTMKSAVLRAYELTGEFYRTKFRNSFKEFNQTYMEYAHSLTKLRKRWLAASGVTTYDQLCELIDLEQYLRGVPQEVKLYLVEKEVKIVDKAATLAENYSLICRSRKKGYENTGPIQNESQTSRKHVGNVNNQNKHVAYQGTYTENGRGGYGKLDLCHYCKKPGHYKFRCPKLEKTSGKTDVGSVANCVFNPTDLSRSLGSEVITQVKDSQDLFQPFTFGGFVSVDKESTPVPVSILRDTGASHSVVVRESIPFVDEVYTGEHVLLKGVGGSTTVPLARLYLKTDLLSQPVTVAVQDSLPVEGVTFLLGNDVAGSRVVPDPIVCSSPLDKDPVADVEKDFPGLFPACAVTRSQTRATESNDGDNSESGEMEDGLSALFANRNTPEVTIGEQPRTEISPELSECVVTRKMLIDAQKTDNTLSSLFHKIVGVDELEKESVCYYVQSGVLMRKFRPSDVPANEPWGELRQVVVPGCYRSMVLNLAHDHIGGHLGVKKTIDKVTRYFYWPGIHSDISKYCQTCHICQIAGKPNQVIPPAPLHPIPAVTEPFSHVLIDCVGPLPKTSKGHQFLLTLMCRSTRYPEAIPLRRITTKTIIPVLLRIFTQFGLPKVIQSDQGSNFTANIFKQVMSTLGIKQHLSSAYHPESQGALERWHQTLKSMLTKYCLETEQQWDEGLPLVLYAIRSTRQESLGVSPNEMLFGRDVRGPLKLLQESWIDENTEELSEYVKNIRKRLKQVHTFARTNLLDAQKRMKLSYDVNSKLREFNEGDKVLLFLPDRKYPLQAKYQGPFTVLGKEGKLNYVIATPGRRKTKRLVHVNLLKEYTERVQKAESQVVNVVVNSGSHNNEVMEDDFTVKMDIKLKNSDVLDTLDLKLTHLETSQKVELATLLHEFTDICSDVPKSTSVVKHDIVLTDGAAHVKQAPYRISPEKRQIMRDEVEFLLSNNLAELSKSEWASPCVLIPKPDGSWRMCTDYRRVNACTVGDSYPLPRIDDIIDSVGNAVFLTKIDMLRGYYQVPLTERAKRISAFVTPDGLYQYKVMPFGLKNAPSTYQRLTSEIVEGLEGVNCYIDDLIIYSNNWNSHITTLRTLFERIRRASLTVNLVKSEFGRATLHFLGHQVGCGKISPITAKVDAICNMPVPKTRKDVQRFLGMAGYYRKFCPNFAEVASPLTYLVSPKNPMRWDERCQTSFDKIKSLLLCKPVLQGPNFYKPFVLHIDASDVAAGAVLMQEGKDSVLHPVSYMSVKFKPHQKNYATIEKEALSLLLALEKFDVYLGSTGNKIIVFSDHNPLTFVRKMKNKNQRLTRWCLILQPYDLEIRHIKGRDNLIADALSRPSS